MWCCDTNFRDFPSFWPGNDISWDAGFHWYKFRLTVFPPAWMFHSVAHIYKITLYKFQCKVFGWKCFVWKGLQEAQWPTAHTRLGGLDTAENTEDLNNKTLIVFQAWKHQQTVDQFQSNNDPNIKHMQLHQPDLCSVILPPPVVWSYCKWLMNVSRGCHRS